MTNRDRSLKSGEREVASSLDGVGQWQKWRYYEAQKYCIWRSVIDVGCGAGYGSYILKEVAGSVVGIDDSGETIEYAKKHYSSNGARYICSDFMSLAPHIWPADVVVAFEFIEHLPDPEKTFQALGVISRDTIILTSPHSSSPVGRFHHQHFSEDDISCLMDGIGFKPAELKIVHFSGGPHVFCVAKRG